MNKIKYALLLMVLFSPITFSFAQNHSASKFSQAISYHSPEVEEAVNAIQKLPESQAIFEKIAKDGPIQILYRPLPSVDFGAMWDADARTITVNSKSPRELGNIICSIIFEMHNTMSNSQFMKLTDMASRGAITKDQYVEYVERMEHTNCLDTVSLLEKGINSKLFPASARWNIYSNFDDHYKVQQLTDHSIWLGKNYDRMCKDPSKRGQPYQGTIKGLSTYSKLDKRDMLYYLALKNDLESSNQQRILKASQRLQKEYADLEDCFHGNAKGKDCSRAIQKNLMMNMVFKQSTIYASMGTEQEAHLAG